jgi:hypothetical protein
MRIAPAIELSAREQDVSGRLVHRSTGEQRLAERAGSYGQVAAAGRGLGAVDGGGKESPRLQFEPLHHRSSGGCTALRLAGISTPE